jgi:nitrate reductase assembly molybdenum cofactor insertion protein NarJ
MKREDMPKAQELVAAAAAWRLASLLVERPRPDWHRELAKLSSEVGAEKLLWAVNEAADGTEEMYHSLFGPGGPVSPREISYCGYEDPGHVMAQLSTFYRAFSFQPRREEPIDHISVEAGFVGYLFLKEAYAEMRNDAEAAAVTKEARERFATEHLGRCARGMTDRPSEMPSYLRNAIIWIAEQSCAEQEAGRESSVQDSRPPVR